MAKPGRPKGSGQGLVPLNVRVEPDLYDGFEAWRERQLVDGEPMPQAVAMRRLLRWALEQVGTVKELASVDKGYLDGMQRGRADYHKAMEKAWQLLRRSE
jgi:hypothetical protein